MVQLALLARDELCISFMLFFFILCVQGWHVLSFSSTYSLSKSSTCTENVAFIKIHSQSEAFSSRERRINTYMSSSGYSEKNQVDPDLKVRRQDDITPITAKQHILLEESYPGSALDNGDYLLKAVRALDRNQENSIIYMGYLIEINSNTEWNIHKSDDTTVCVATLSSSDTENIISSDNNFAYDAACQVLCSLIHHMILLEQNDFEEKGRSIMLQLEKEDNFLLDAANDLGFNLVSRNKENSDPGISMEWNNPCRATRFLNEYAFSKRGTSSGIVSLEILGMLCRRRVAYDFDEQSHCSLTNRTIKSGNNRVLSTYRNLIPEITRDEVHEIMGVIKRNRWLSTNLDSVDMLPSLHLNLVTDGKPKYDNVEDQEESSEIDEVTGYDFKTSVEKITKLLEPHIYSNLLPRARELVNSKTLEVSEIFLRSYGQGVQPENDDQVYHSEHDANNNSNSNTRLGISAHYDVFSSLTSVIALDNVAAEGKSGLYTVLEPSLGGVSNSQVNEYKHIGVSNHASLRRFFPLEAGDAVLHSWDILHGVDIEPTKNRTSLIVWFADYGEKTTNDLSHENDKNLPPPWLINPDEDDDIRNFVLASAIDSSPEAMDHKESDQLDNALNSNNPDLCYKSASRGNSFGLCRLGSLCDDGMVGAPLSRKITQLLDDLNKNSVKDFKRELNHLYTVENNQSEKILERGLWFEAAMRGNPLAQVSLADLFMEDCMTLPESSKTNMFCNGQIMKKADDLMLMAALLFSMAAQQGDEAAVDALSRVMSMHQSQLNNVNKFLTPEEQEERILESPIVRTILAAQR